MLRPPAGVADGNDNGKDQDVHHGRPTTRKRASQKKSRTVTSKATNSDCPYNLRSRMGEVDNLSEDARDELSRGGDDVET